ncbi:MAG: hypothetical protein V1743_03380 [Nanoarchaeota archaeon]
MDKKTLVEKDLEQGKKLLETLDKYKYPVKGALWYFEINSNSYKLIIISDIVEKIGLINGYAKLNNIILKENIDLAFDDISLISNNHTIPQTLRHMIKTSPSAIMEIRSMNNTINGIFFPDLYIYRLA